MFYPVLPHSNCYFVLPHLNHHWMYLFTTPIWNITLIALGTTYHIQKREYQHVDIDRFCFIIMGHFDECIFLWEMPNERIAVNFDIKIVIDIIDQMDMITKS